MGRFSDLITKPAREMSAYSPSVPFRVAAAGTQAQIINLDSNENPFGPSPRAMEAMRSASSAANFYPEDDSTQLRRKLAVDHDVTAEQVLVTAGSTALLSLLCQTMLGPGRNAVTSKLSFIVYGMAVRATGAQLIEVPMRDDAFDLSAILDAINDDTRIVLLANPNNPTGTMVSAAAVDKFIAEVPDHVVVILDEAYCEFALDFAAHRSVKYSRALSNLRQGANVVVLRTFSKAHGLAGLRVGYGLGPAELLSYCARMRDTYSVSSMAQAAALAALDDQEFVRRVVQNNTAQSIALTEGLAELGYRVVPTWANFIYYDVGGDAAAIAGQLLDHGVSVRPMGGWGAPTCIRVSIGTPEQNQIFLNAMRKIHKGSQPV
jgi:histidinol-phosphate aminotransferase